MSAWKVKCEKAKVLQNALETHRSLQKLFNFETAEGLKIMR